METRFWNDFTTNQVVFQDLVCTLFKMVIRNFFLSHDKSILIILYFKVTSIFQMVLVTLLWAFQKISVANIFAFLQKEFYYLHLRKCI